MPLFEANKNLTELPELHQGLKRLNCDLNNLTELPPLPKGLLILQCPDNNLTELPELPQKLQTLLCCNNNLTELPELPQTLKYLSCENNNLIELPELPQGLSDIYCFQKKISDLFELPPLASATHQRETQRREAPDGGKQKEIYFGNNLTLKQLIINNSRKRKLCLNETNIPQDIKDYVSEAKLFRCTQCHIRLPEYCKYKKEYYMHQRRHYGNLCCYKYSCISCNSTKRKKQKVKK